MHRNSGDAERRMESFDAQQRKTMALYIHIVDDQHSVWKDKTNLRPERTILHFVLKHEIKQFAQCFKKKKIGAPCCCLQK